MGNSDIAVSWVDGDNAAGEFKALLWRVTTRVTSKQTETRHTKEKNDRYACVPGFYFQSEKVHLRPRLQMLRWHLIDRLRVGMMAAGPEAVARVIEKAISASRPRTRYPVTAAARLLMGLRRWLPDGAFDAMLRTQFR